MSGNNDWRLVARALPAYVAGRGNAASPRILKFDVTYRCRLNCEFCFYWSDGGRDATSALIRGRKEMSLDQIEAFLVPLLRDQKVQYINISGGEPLLRADINEILLAISSAGPSIGINSSLDGLTDRHLETLERIHLRNAQFSIHGTEVVHDQLVKRPGAHKALIGRISGLRSAVKAGGREASLSCCFVVVAKNQHCIAETVARMRDCGVDRFYVHFLEWQDGDRVGEQRPNSRALMPDPEHRLIDADIVFQQVRHARDICRGNGMKVISHPFDPQSAKDLLLWYNDPTYKHVDKCFFLWMEARIDPFGDVIPCLYITEPAGNIMVDRFSDIWRGQRMGAVRAEIQDQLRPVCHKCCKLSRKWQNMLTHFPASRPC